MRKIHLIILTALAIAAIVGNAGIRPSVFGSEIAFSKIHRCTVEDFMMEHKILYHLARYDVASFTMLCLSSSSVQPNLLASK